LEGGTGGSIVADDFRFEIDRVKSPFSQADLIASLKEYARVHKTDSFGMREYDAWTERIASAATIQIVADDVKLTL
ncbi:MAG: hypothetical protein U1E22_10615, partial [Coriobacteriia bacterium]|nr:hypothetical protein [Coriobacteriia bacterium]